MNDQCSDMNLANYPKRGFTEEEAAFYLGVSRSFLRQSRMDGVRKNRTPGPPFVKLGRMIRYVREDLDAWLDAQRKGGNAYED
jgi:excisionase family DNA binding protein